jgi:hypothetical protein
VEPSGGTKCACHVIFYELQIIHFQSVFCVQLLTIVIFFYQKRVDAKPKIFVRLYSVLRLIWVSNPRRADVKGVLAFSIFFAFQCLSAFTSTLTGRLAGPGDPRPSAQNGPGLE